MTTDGYVPFFTHHVLDWRWKSAFDYRNRAINDMGEATAALVELLAGR